jgi:hypothetical protein
VSAEQKINQKERTNEMKTLLTLCIVGILFVGCGELYAGSELNSNATYIKNTYPILYENTIKYHALQKWDTNFRMVVHSINTQSDELFAIVNEFESEHTNILYQSILKWSYDGYEVSNKKMFKDITTVNIEQMLPLHVNWRMEKHNYDSQVEAKNAF